MFKVGHGMGGLTLTGGLTGVTGGLPVGGAGFTGGLAGAGLFGDEGLAGGVTGFTGGFTGGLTGVTGGFTGGLTGVTGGLTGGFTDGRETGRFAMALRVICCCCFLSRIILTAIFKSFLNNLKFLSQLNT